MNPLARILAVVIALSAIIGIAIEFWGPVSRGYTPVASAWLLLGYFTIITNALMAVLFGAIALGFTARHRPRLLAGAGLAMALVGIVFALLLSGLRELVGAAQLADRLLHAVNPTLVPLYWLAFAPKGTLRPRDALLWALYPLSYFAYALIRGGLTGFYAYPFLDVASNGWSQTAVNALVIAVIFMLAGLGVVWLDRMLDRRAATGSHM